MTRSAIAAVAGKVSAKIAAALSYNILPKFVLLFITLMRWLDRDFGNTKFNKTYLSNFLMQSKYYHRYLVRSLLLISVCLTSCNVNNKNNTQTNSIDGQKLSITQAYLIILKRNITIKGKQVYQKVDEIGNLLKEGKYQEIEQFFQKAIAEKTFTASGGFYAWQVLDRIFGDGNIVPFHASWQTYVDRWIEKYPRSSTAYLFRSIFYSNYAWEIRGNKFNYKTPENARQGFTDKMILSVNDIKQSLALDSENPLTMIQILSIGNTARMPRETFEAYLQKAISLVPYSIEAYAAKATYLEPQWHGSEAELLAFVRETVKSAPQGSALPMLIINAHDALCGYSGLSHKDYISRPEVWQEVQASYERLIKEQPESGFPAFKYGEIARQIGREDIAQYNYNVAWEREADHPVIYKKLSPLIR